MVINYNISWNRSLCFIKMKLKIEDIVFWIIILMIIALAFWLLSGSPQEISAIVSLALFVVASEILLWRALFRSSEKTNIKLEKLDKKTALSFERLKNNTNIKFLEINNNLNEIKRIIKK